MDLRPARKQPKRRRFAALSGYRDWQLHDAKAHLSDLVRRARNEGPQRITVYGEDAVIVISASEFAQLLAPSRPERSLHALLSESPLRDLAFGEEGERSPVRDVGL
ncbi:MAG: type II toxin-antitoxin system Phd/YefM family antitoxin [Vicinamibacterales bacterium]